MVGRIESLPQSRCHRTARRRTLFAARGAGRTLLNVTVPQQISLAGRTVPLLDRARIYTCGITPYDVTHLGHAATFVWADALARVLRALTVEPVVCRNVTDVDDVLDAAADRAGDYYDRFAAVQQFRFENDMALLNVRQPEHEPRAHRYVDVVVRLAVALLATGDAYVRGGSVYFRGRHVVECERGQH